MIMHNSPSAVLSSCDSFVDSPMVKHQSDLHHYNHYQDSDSSRSPSIYSSSLSPQTSSGTVLNKTSISTAAAVPADTGIANLSDIDPQLAQHVEYELGLTRKNGSGTRKNAWGNLSYAELISKAITTSAEQRLTLSEIYDWMIKYVPFFRNKVDRVSSAGWKVSISLSFSLLINLTFSFFFKRILFDIIYLYIIDLNVYKVKAQENPLGGLLILMRRARLLI